MSGWIKFEKDMANDARLAQAASALLERYLIANRTAGGGSDLSIGDASRFVTHALRGALVTLWCYADEHVRDDDSLPCDVTALDAIIGMDGFCDLLPPVWLTEREDGCVVLPGYCQKNGIVSKRKTVSAGAERTRRWREKQRQSGDGARDALHETSQARHRDVTKSVDLDLRPRRRPRPQEQDSRTRVSRLEIGMRKPDAINGAGAGGDAGAEEPPAAAPLARAHVSAPESRQVFERIQARYPQGLHRGDHWTLAERAVYRLLDDGVPAADLIAAVDAYHEQQLALQAVGTERVLRPQNFFAENRWRGPFPKPKTAAIKKTIGERLAALTHDGDAA